MKEEIYVGQMFGRWRVKSTDYIREKYSHRYYLCECTCDKHTERYVDEYNLKNGKSQSCGCRIRESASARFSTHGKTGTRLYHVWCSIKERCYITTHKSYANYGGRGITMCDEWLNDFEAFEKWAFENGYDENAPKGQCTIDRIDVDKGYSPDNCRWISLTEQNDNRTTTIWLTYNGRTQTLLQWSKELGINPNTMRTRYSQGWSVEKMLTCACKERWGKNALTYQGETHSIGFWARKLGLSESTMRRRYLKGYPLEIIFSEKKIDEIIQKGGIPTL